MSSLITGAHVAKKPSTEEIYAWLDSTTTKVIAAIESKITRFEQQPTPQFEQAEEERKYHDQESRYQFLKMLLDRKDANENGKKNEIHRVVRGYLTEFIRQTEQQITVCNIENGRNPEAKVYWESRPPEEFREEMVSGFFHTAVAFGRFKSLMKTQTRRKAAWEATGEIIRTCIDVFKAEYPILDETRPPVASLYNDHLKTIEASLGLERALGERVRADRSRM